MAKHNAFGLTTFASNMLTMPGIAAATDYGIFLFGRYREARAAGQDRETAYYTTFRSVSPVIIGWGLTIAGAIYCLSFARLPYFSTMGAPAGSGGVVTAAGLVFAVTMAAMLGSNLRVIAQMGSTIAIGLLGRWFWWPQVVHPRGDYHLPRSQPPTPESETAPLAMQRP